jgi:hypothetical protein
MVPKPRLAKSNAPRMPVRNRLYADCFGMTPHPYVLFFRGVSTTQKYLVVNPRRRNRPVGSNRNHHGGRFTLVNDDQSLALNKVVFIGSF